MNKTRLAVSLAVCLALRSASVFAQDESTVRPEKPAAAQARKALPAPPAEKWLEFDAGAALSADNNVNHLLTDSAVDSNARLPDTVVHSNAALEATPAFGERLRADLAYGYDRFDFRRHPVFSYYDHALSALFFPRIARGVELEAGGLFTWIGDNTGGISDDQTGRLGLIWRARPALRLKAGYERERLSVKVDSLRNARANAGYAGVLALLPYRQTAFATYRYRAHDADGADFAYRAHSVVAGLISHWTSRLKSTALLSYTGKRYDNVDDRFLQRRRDDSFAFTVKPAVRLADRLSAYASFEYSQNRSNVRLKSYYDQQASVGLELSL